MTQYQPTSTIIYTHGPVLYSKSIVTIDSENSTPKSDQNSLKDEDADDDSQEKWIYCYSMENVHLNKEIFTSS